ncbi:MAG: hypothetical protein SZ59_C0002G0083 [candidate division TM6 bacterium GW2011_GWF2_28_16]|nr:MAG: hypothetical protein SZ59_C0002G0083 [candidate division TM6 bacterium GW2011_GWF2_28_16]
MLIDGSYFLYVLFKLTLFGLFIIVMYKLIVAFVVPYLNAEILNIKKDAKDLEDKMDLLNRTRKSVELKIENQKKELNYLENKINLWNNNLLQKKNKHEQEKQIILNKVIEKRKIQSNNINILNLEKIVIPESIKQAYIEIEKIYDGGKGLILTRELIDKIKQ